MRLVHTLMSMSLAGFHSSDNLAINNNKTVVDVCWSHEAHKAVYFFLLTHLHTHKKKTLTTACN